MTVRVSLLFWLLVVVVSLSSALVHTTSTADADLVSARALPVVSRYVVATVDGRAASALAAALAAADGDASRPDFSASTSQTPAALSAGLLFASLSPAAAAWVRSHPDVVALEADALVGSRPAVVGADAAAAPAAVAGGAPAPEGATAAALPSLSSVPWSLDRLDQRSLPLDAEYHLSRGDAGQGVDIYIVDSGVRASHDEFGGRVFLHPGGNFSPDQGADDLTDRNGHGTFCASLAAGALVGVAPG